jgi:hypothetical protein
VCLPWLDDLHSATKPIVDQLISGVLHARSDSVRQTTADDFGAVLGIPAAGDSDASAALNFEPLLALADFRSVDNSAYHVE